MIFLDANIIIYAFKPEYGCLLQQLMDSDENLACSDIVRLEVLGFHGLQLEDTKRLAEFFEAIRIIPVSREIVDIAIGLRQQKAIGSPDAIIAATALATNQKLWTSNVRDFKWIEDLKWHNPIGDNSV